MLVLGPQQTKLELEHLSPNSHYKCVKNNVSISLSIILSYSKMDLNNFLKVYTIGQNFELKKGKRMWVKSKG